MIDFVYPDENNANKTEPDGFRQKVSNYYETFFSYSKQVLCCIVYTLNNSLYYDILQR